MNQETDDKVESIIISAVNRLYEKEATRGLDYEDLRCLEIIYKIKKENKDREKPVNPLSAPTRPDDLMELLRAVKGVPKDDNGE